MSLYNSLDRTKGLSELDDKPAARVNLGIAAGAYTVTAADDTANFVAIPTGLAVVTMFQFQVVRALAVLNADAAVIGASSVGNGATYVLTAGDIIHWIAVGSK